MSDLYRMSPAAKIWESDRTILARNAPLYIIDRHVASRRSTLDGCIEVGIVPKKEKCNGGKHHQKKSKDQQPGTRDPHPSRNAALCLLFLCLSCGLFGWSER